MSKHTCVSSYIDLLQHCSTAEPSYTNKLQDRYSNLEVLRLSQILERAKSSLRDIENRDQLFDNKLNAILIEKREILEALEKCRNERDEAIGERFLLSTNPRQHPKYKQILKASEELQIRLAESKFSRIQTQAHIENMREEQETNRVKLIKKQECIYRLKKEHEKFLKQRDVMHSKLISGEPTHKPAAPRKLHHNNTGTAGKPSNHSSSNNFLYSMYSSPPVKTRSMMSAISKTAPAKSRNVKVE